MIAGRMTSWQSSVEATHCRITRWHIGRSPCCRVIQQTPCNSENKKTNFSAFQAKGSKGWNVTAREIPFPGDSLRINASKGFSRCAMQFRTASAIYAFHNPKQMARMNPFFRDERVRPSWQDY